MISQLNNVFKIIVFLFFIKLCYLGLAFFTNHLQSLAFDPYVNTIKMNDSGWYEKITNEGYSIITNKRDLGYSEGPNIKQSEWAFFPFYPYANRFLIGIFDWNFNQSGFFLAMIFSVTSFLALYYFCVEYFKDTDQALYTTFLVMAFPFHYYFSMLYTEAIFFTSMIGCFIAINEKKYFMLSILLVPLCLIRPNGIIIVVPLYLYYLERNNIFDKKSIHWNLLFNKKTILESLYFLTAPISFGLYCLYQWHKTGYYLAFTLAQAGWNKKFMFPFMAFFRHGDIANQINSIYSIVGIIVAIFAWKKLSISLNILIWLSILLPLCSGSVISMPRYISVIFPLFIFISSILNTYKYKNAILVLLLMIQICTYYFWLIRNPLSY